MTKTIVVDCFLLTLLRRYSGSQFSLIADESYVVFPGYMTMLA